MVARLGSTLLSITVVAVCSTCVVPAERSPNEVRPNNVPERFPASAPEITTAQRRPAMHSDRVDLDRCWILEPTPGWRNEGQLFCVLDEGECKATRKRLRGHYQHGVTCFEPADDCVMARLGRMAECTRAFTEDCEKLVRTRDGLPPGVQDLRCESVSGSRAAAETEAKASAARSARKAFLERRSAEWDKEPCSRTNAEEAVEFETGGPLREHQVASKQKQCWSGRVQRCQARLDAGDLAGARECWKVETWPVDYSSVSSCLDELAGELAFVQSCVAMPEKSKSESKRKAACLDAFNQRPDPRNCSPLDHSSFQQKVAEQLDLEATYARVSPRRAATTSVKATGIRATACFRKATELLRTARKCGIAIGARSAEGICRELIEQEQFTDNMAVGRLDVFMNDGCGKLRLAIENDRV